MPLRTIAGRGGLFCWRFLGFRIEEARTSPENLTVWPVLFAKENLAVAWIAVEPAGDEREMLAEFLAGGAYGWPLGVLRVLRVRRVSLQIILEDMFGGARLTGDFAEAQEERFGEAAAVDAEDADGLFLRGALENYGVEIRDATGKLGTEAQRVVEFFKALVKLRGALEIEIGAGAFTVVFDGGAQRVAVGVEKLHQPLNFGIVFLFGAAGKARREAHFHFGIDAAGKSRIAADFNLAAADFEQVESLLGEGERGFSGRERAVVSPCYRRAGFVDSNAARDVAARIGVAQADFQHGGRTQAGEFAVALREKTLGMLIVGENLFKRGAGEAIANAAREFAQIEALAVGIGGAEEALQPAAQILGANQKRFGVFRARFDQANGGFGRQNGEEIFFRARGIEGEAAVQFEHGDRI